MIALAFILVIVGYAVAALVLGYLIHRLTKRQYSFTLCSGVLLSLPVVYIAYLILPGYLRLQLLCNSDDRTVIYRTVSAPGYLTLSSWRSFCSEGWQGLLEQGYKYRECATASYSSGEFLDSPTFYRFTIEPIGQPGCENSVTAKTNYKRKEYSKKYKTLLGERCLSVQIIDKPQSRYGVFHTNGYVEFTGRHNPDLPQNKNNRTGLIHYLETRAFELDTQESLSVSHNYSFDPLGSYFPMYVAHRCDEQKYTDMRKVIAP